MGGARTLHAAQITGRFEDGSAYTSDRTIGDDELIDLVAVLERDQSALLGSNHLGQKDIDHAGAGSPGEVEARHRIAVSKSHSAAAFGPADIRHQAKPQIVQVLTLVARCELDVRLGPLTRPVIFALTVESGCAHPVLHCQLEGVLDAESALLGAVHEEESAERPKCLRAEVGSVLLFHDKDFAARARQFVGGDQSRQPCPDNDDVSLFAHDNSSSDWLFWIISL